MARGAPAHNRADLTGQTFCYLKVIGAAGYRAYGESGCKKAVWKCVCKCGNESIVDTGALTSGNTKSCGCKTKEARKARAKPLKSKYPRTYRIWQAMLNRCRCESMKMWHRYGGRGISVCDRWLIFDNFISDMGPSEENLSIDRIDNDGNYDPDNCKWSTREEQSKNKSTNNLISFRGETKILKEWAAQIGIDQTSLKERLDKWPLEKALTHPPKVLKKQTYKP